MKKSILETLIDQFIPSIRKGFLDAIRGIVDSVRLGDVEEAIRTGDPLGAVRAIGMENGAMRPLEKALETAFETGGVLTAEAVPRRATQAVFHFNVRNSRAEKFLREQSAGLVTRIADDTRVGIRNLITEGVRDGRNPRNIALDIVGRINPVTKRREGGIIGLTVPQERWAANARVDLEQLSERYFSRVARDKRFDRTVRAAIAKGTPLSKETINKLIGRYRDNLLLIRGETIARTEAIASLGRSEQEAIKQSVDQGVVSASHVKRVWDSAGDRRVRDSHVAMDGQTVGLDEPFRTPNGDFIMYPADSSLGAPGNEVINCRCTVRMAVDWLASARDG